MAARRRGARDRRDAVGSAGGRFRGRFGQLVAAGHNFVWNYALRLPVVAIEREGQNDLRYYVYSPEGELLHSIDAAGNARHYYHLDERGNVLFLTGDGGAVTDAYAYTPYGEIVGRTGTTANPFTFLEDTA